MSVSFEEARNKMDRRYDKVVEYKDAWWFTYEGAEKIDGGDQGFVVLKETGEILRPYQYFLHA